MENASTSLPKHMEVKELIQKGARIPLFDVDWTLLVGGEEGNKVHHAAFNHALHTVYNQPTASKDEIMTEGMIDTQILIEILKLHNVSEKEAKSKMPEALKAMTEYFMAHADEGSFKPMPGVTGLLSSLKEKGLPLGLLTGNVAEIAWEKLRRAGIKDFFSFGGFGSMAYKRVDLIEIARKEATEILGIEVPVHNFVIVGDSPLDIACARDGGIEVIAVGAGHHKAHELVHADLTLDSLEELAKVSNFLKVT